MTNFTYARSGSTLRLTTTIKIKFAIVIAFSLNQIDIKLIKKPIFLLFFSQKHIYLCLYEMDGSHKKQDYHILYHIAL